MQASFYFGAEAARVSSHYRTKLRVSWQIWNWTSLLGADGVVLLNIGNSLLDNEEAAWALDSLNIQTIFAFAAVWHVLCLQSFWAVDSFVDGISSKKHCLSKCPDSVSFSLFSSAFSGWPGYCLEPRWFLSSRIAEFRQWFHANRTVVTFWTKVRTWTVLYWTQHTQTLKFQVWWKHVHRKKSNQQRGFARTQLPVSHDLHASSF